jgi:cathepsin L
MTMHRVLLLLFLAQCALARLKPRFSFSDQEDAVAWSEDVLKLKKQYDSKNEKEALAARKEVATLSREWREEFDVKWSTKLLQKKLKVFTDNLWYVGEKNVELAKAKSPWWVSQGKFADLTFSQFRREYLIEDLKVPKLDFDLEDLKIRLFRCFDWRDEDVVTAVRNQGACGSCWAFAAIATIESRYLIENGETVDENPINLSEQQLVDCVRSPRRDLNNDRYDSGGCTGGWSEEAMEYVRQHNVTYESAYPYTASNGVCNQNPLDGSSPEPAMTLGGPNPGWTGYSGGNSTIIKSLLAVSPVANYIRVENGFQLYNGGVMDTACAGQGINHATAIVGYCNSKLLFGNFNYWIVKNSWGTRWGEDGYYRIQTRRSGAGICESQSSIFQPTIPTEA